MNLFLATAIIIASVAAAVGAMLVLRLRAPEGGHFKDSDRASGDEAAKLGEPVVAPCDERGTPITRG